MFGKSPRGFYGIGNAMKPALSGADRKIRAVFVRMARAVIPERGISHEPGFLR